MLIKCPECGKEISDQAPACIHCGFPMDNKNIVNNKYICTVNGKQYDLSHEYQMILNNQKVVAIKGINEKTGIGLKQSKEIADSITNNHQIPEVYNSPSNEPKCPKCGCTNIQVVRRNWSFFGGFSTNATDRVCAKCNYKW